jgi:membrane protein implicated in regulation of membrane protease activity
MAESTIWWLLAGTAIGIELATGTFYLLMLAAGLSAAAIAAHAGASSTVQIVIAAVVGAGAVLAWRAYKLSKPSSMPANANRDVNLDIGETVYVGAWDPDGTTTVKYRGANWAVSSSPGEALTSGTYQVAEVVGSRLIVRKQ